MKIFKATVYRIVCLSHPEVQYVGSTFNKLRHRWATHKCMFKRWLEGKGRCVSIYPYYKQYGIENFKLIKIKDYRVCAEHKKDRRHLDVYEQLWINKLNCVNVRDTICYLRPVNKGRLCNYGKCGKPASTGLKLCELHRHRATMKMREKRKVCTVI